MANTAEFLSKIKVGAISGWHKYGILPSVTAAQAALESAWGTSKLSLPPNNNLFGIKGSYNGQSVQFPTWEVINGQNVTVNASFRKYPDWNASVEDHGSFFHEGPRYLGLIGMRDYAQQARAIKAAGYATDPEYANKLISTIEYNNLQAWDNEAFTGSPAPVQPTPQPTPGNQTYTVQPGDALSVIAQKFGTTTDNLARLNGISNPNLIYAGQVLNVGGSGGGSTERNYTVKSGDALSVIAQNLGVSTQHLINTNGISNPNLIYPGQVLKY